MEERKRGAVEKLHPAHCIERRRGGGRGRGEEETRGERVVEAARRGAVSGVVGTPKIASRYDDAQSGPILDFSQFASSKAAGYTEHSDRTSPGFHFHIDEKHPSSCSALSR